MSKMIINGYSECDVYSYMYNYRCHCQTYVTVRIYSIRRRGFFSFQAAGGGSSYVRTAFLEAVFIPTIINVCSLAVHSTVSLCLLSLKLLFVF